MAFSVIGQAIERSGRDLTSKAERERQQMIKETNMELRRQETEKRHNEKMQEAYEAKMRENDIIMRLDMLNDRITSLEYNLFNLQNEFNTFRMQARNITPDYLNLDPSRIGPLNYIPK